MTDYVIDAVKEQIATTDIRPGLQQNRVGQWFINEQGGNWDNVTAPVRRLYRQVVRMGNSLVLFHDRQASRSRLRGLHCDT